jgi:hypothetical protein
LLKAQKNAAKMQKMWLIDEIGEWTGQRKSDTWLLELTTGTNVKFPIASERKFSNRQLGSLTEALQCGPADSTPLGNASGPMFQGVRVSCIKRI